MTSSPASPSPLPGLAGDGAFVLAAAMETAPAAIYVLSASSDDPVWANARARALGTSRDGMPVVAGRLVVEVLAAVLRTGVPETLCGPLGPGGPMSTLMVRPVRVGDGPGALVILESDDAAADPSLWPKASDGVEQAQLSLLPPSLPLLPDLHLSGSYHRASAPEAAGGDWYDTVALGSGRVALVVGDAVGHGVPAAGAMSRLRGAMRSSALRDPSPSAVLTALDVFAAQMDDVEGASVFYGVLDAGTGDLDYAAAGHPSPLVVGPDGAATFLPVPPRAPLGSLPNTSTRVSRHVLEQGATLVLFSNGAVSGPVPEAAQALERLTAAATDALAASGAPGTGGPDELAAAIVEGIRSPAGWLDDVAVLVAHRRQDAHEPLQLDLTADPAALPGVRRRLNSWLTAVGMNEQDRVGVMVAVGEACANAAEHAYRGSEPGPMSVRAQVDVDGVLTVTVRDEGTWRPPDRDPGDRGRGLLIMRQLVDGVVLEEEAQGTTVTLSLRLRRQPDADVHRPAASSAATVSVDREGPRPVVRVSGAVDEFGAEQVRIRLLEASHGGTGRVELDLVGVSLFSSAAVRVVLAIARIGRDEGWRLVVHAPEGGVTRHVLEISGLGGLVDLR
ncbi:MAG TPA: SpoIIE family protein phosphatase [Blastococcus sp.]